MTLTQILLVFLGLAAWDILKHFYRGVKLWREYRRREKLQYLYAWRRARIAGARITYPTKHLNLEGVEPSIPPLGIDVPVFAERNENHG